MKAPKLRLGTLLDRLGVPAMGASLPVAESVQPVVIIGDARRVVSRVRLPEAHVQCYTFPTVAPDHAKAEVRSAGEGGTQVSVVGTSENWGGASWYWCYSFASVPMPGLTGSVLDMATALARNTVDPAFPVRSRIRRGLGAQDLFGAGSNDEDPIVLGGGQSVAVSPSTNQQASASPIWQLQVWLPPGRFLWLEAYNPGVPIVWNIRIREYPEP